METNAWDSILNAGAKYLVFKIADCKMADCKMADCKMADCKI